MLDNRLPQHHALTGRLASCPNSIVTFTLGR